MQDRFNGSKGDSGLGVGVDNDGGDGDGDGDEDIHHDRRAGGAREERSRTTKLVGKLVIILTLISMLFVGVFINILQLILVVTIGFSDNLQWRRWHKRINSQLVYILFSPPICLLYYWSNASLRIELDDLASLMELSSGPMLAIVIPNHSYELDYMVSFLLADQLAGVGYFKSMSKEELKYLPIFGWSLWMADIIYVRRNWSHDRKTIDKKLNALFDYDQTLLGIFAEGTRFTPDKHRLSVEFARERNLKAFKYHLVPRPRGFNYAVRHYLREILLNGRAKERDFRILNLQIVMPDRPSFRDFIEGRQLRADIFCEEVKLSDEIRQEVLDSADEDSCPRLSQLLMDIYARKDQLVDEYLANGGKFSRNPETGGLFPYRKGGRTLLIWFAGLCFTYGSLGYLALTGYLANSVLFWTLLVSLIVGSVQMLKRIASESKIPKNPPPSSRARVRLDDSSKLSQPPKLV